LKKNFISLICLCLFCSLLLSGCGKKSQELKTYKDSMETFCKNISYLNQEINAVDPSSATSTKELLGYLDSLKDQFSQMAALTVPAEFPNIPNFASDASENMTNAVTYYHKAYESTPFNQNYANAANEYYSRANERLKYILEALHGETVSETQFSVGSAAGTTEQSVQSGTSAASTSAASGTPAAASSAQSE